MFTIALKAAPALRFLRKQAFWHRLSLFTALDNQIVTKLLLFTPFRSFDKLDKFGGY